MTLTQEITLDIYDPPYFEYVNAKQADNVSRILIVTLTASGEQIKPSAGTETAVFRALKPDRTSVIDPAAIGGDGKITVALTDQALACPGRVEADISILKGDEVLSSATFYIQVDRAPVSGEQIVSSDEFLVMVQATRAAEAAAGEARKAAGEADAAAGRADTAAGRANDAADKANTAASGADTSAKKANAAATRAEDAAASADASGKKADDAAAAANAAAGNANTATVGADAATIRANDAAGLIENMTVSASMVAPGGMPTATLTKEAGYYALALGLVIGDKGDKGDKGAAFTYEDFTKEQLAALTGPTGPQGATGPAGPAGQTGPQGPAGANGVSPTVTTSKSGKVTTITIKDASGEKRATINDGADGAAGGTGPAGPAGPQGPTGPAGPNSISASTESSVNGLLKGANGKVAAAVAGMDYVLPSGNITGSSGSCTGNAATATKVGHMLTFTGRTSTTFDGSTERTVDIPTDKNIFLAAHPVGSYYWSDTAASPASLFGGTWTQIKDRFVLALGDTYNTVGNTGGAASVTSSGVALSKENLPPEAMIEFLNQSGMQKDTYAVYAPSNMIVDNNRFVWCKMQNLKDVGLVSEYSRPHTHTVTTMPPYIVAYCWRRTA